MKAEFVLDSSVAMAWCFEDENEPYAERVLDRLLSATAIVPALWKLETANVLLLAERKKRISWTQATRLAAFLAELKIIEDVESVSRGLSHLLALAREYELTVYDAAYLDLAIRLGLPIATLDQDLKRSAKKAGVPLFS